MKEVFCKNCRYYKYSSLDALFPRYNSESPHRCMRNVKKKRNPAGDTITEGDEDCFIENANLNCKHFEPKQKWYLKLISIIKGL